MRRWPRSPDLLRLFVGQHIVNGVSVGVGVMAVAFVASTVLGFAAGPTRDAGRNLGEHLRSSCPVARQGPRDGLRFRACARLHGRDPARLAVASGRPADHRRDRLCRRPRHRARPLGGRARHASCDSDGVRARSPARELRRRVARRGSAGRRRSRLHRVGAAGDDRHRRQLAATGRGRIDPRILHLSAGGRRGL